MGIRNSSLSRSETTLGFQNSNKSQASRIVRSRSRPWQVDSSRKQDEYDHENENVNLSQRLDNLDISHHQYSTLVSDIKIFSSALKNSSKKSNHQHSVLKSSSITSTNTACRHKLQKIFRVITDRKSAIIRFSPTKSPTDYHTIANKSHLDDNNFATLKVIKLNHKFLLNNSPQVFIFNEF